MTDVDSADGTLGECPNCGARIPESAVLIEYEDGDGRSAYVDCPECSDVVKPE